MKAITLGLVVSAMIVKMALAGTPDSLGITITFLVITLLNLAEAMSLLKNVS